MILSQDEKANVSNLVKSDIDYIMRKKKMRLILECRMEPDIGFYMPKKMR